MISSDARGHGAGEIALPARGKLPANSHKFRPTLEVKRAGPRPQQHITRTQ